MKIVGAFYGEVQPNTLRYKVMDKGYLAIVIFNVIFWSILGLIKFIGEVGEIERDQAYFKEYGKERRPQKKKKRY